MRLTANNSSAGKPDENIGLIDCQKSGRLSVNRTALSPPFSPV